MLTKLLRSFLNIVENPRSLPSFLGIYSLLWLIWHYQFLLRFGSATGNVVERLGNAKTAMDEFQFFSVFFVTITLFILYSGFQVFIKYSREHVDKVDREKNNNLTELDKKNDMEQLVSTLEILQNKLRTSQENEKKAKIEEKNIMAKLMVVQTKLDETAADLEVLKNTQSELPSDVTLC
ncbi:hypothetical protein A9Q98_13085 [Thalassotalea sp. 42_200_T64]|nr:hypothetical protein A9Q98_13085 [Thalassotalea sp. 42_200_T64]